MNKKVVYLTIFLSIVCICFLGFQIFRYYGVKGESQEKEIQNVVQKIQKIEKKIQEKELEKQSLEKVKDWKIEVYQAWKKEVNS